MIKNDGIHQNAEITMTNVKVYYVKAPSFVGQQLPTKEYELVYEKDVPKVGFDEEKMVCEELFEQFNIGDHGGKRIRSMSVGDKIVFDNYTQYICDTVGWIRDDRM